MPTKRPKHIPLHERELSKHDGFMIERLVAFNDFAEEDATVLQAHRDDHYMFLVQESGYSSFVLDFEAMELTGPNVIYILPGQVHYFNKITKATGWILAADASMIDSEQRAVLENRPPASQTLQMCDISIFLQAMQLLHDVCNQAAFDLSHKAIHSILQAIINMIAAAFTEATVGGAKTLRAQSITRDFKTLVHQHFITIKNPAQYACMLHISLSYLNEVVKNTTGFTVSYWIQQQVLLEAKRMLYYTGLDVKQIAYELGYDDHTYFSRLFRKAVQCTPLDFRRRHRELSNHSG